MKVYALCTLHETGWGTREGIGEPEKARERADDLHSGHFDPPIHSSPRISKTQQQHQPRPSITRESNAFKTGQEEELEMKPVAL